MEDDDTNDRPKPCAEPWTWRKAEVGKKGHISNPHLRPAHHLSTGGHTMHDAFRKRLEVLEEAHRLANAPLQLINIRFANPDGTRVAPTVARGRDFECYRYDDEDADTFTSRANDEARMADRHGARIGVQVLIFSDELDAECCEYP
jgi:hypothetical protein